MYWQERGAVGPLGCSVWVEEGEDNSVLVHVVFLYYSLCPLFNSSNSLINMIKQSLS